jgi:hypothetical protein
MKFIYPIDDQISFLIGNYLGFCKKLTKRQQLRQQLFKQSVEKLDYELDIRNISRELKKLRFLFDVTLSKY